MTTIVYTVTEYGCNSSPSDMWVPKVRIFTTYDAAYEHYKSVAPSPDPTWGATNKCAQKRADDEVGMIEYICQSGDDGERYCAKRPYGAVIARCVVE